MKHLWAAHSVIAMSSLTIKEAVLILYKGQSNVKGSVPDRLATRVYSKSDVQGVSRHGERGGAGVPRGFLLEELGEPGDVVREFSRCGIEKRLREGRVGVRRAGDDDATRGRSAAPCGCAARRERRVRAERHGWGPECARRAG